MLERWARDFGSLLTPPVKNEREKAFVEEISKSNKEAEMSMSYSPPNLFNRDIGLEEVQHVINKSKNNKAPGLDSITYEMLKNDISHCIDCPIQQMPIG